MTRIAQSNNTLVKVSLSLIAVYLVTILLTAFPIDLSSAEWGRRWSSVIIDACSLSLVGTGLLRFSSATTGDEQTIESHLSDDTTIPEETGTRLTAIRLANAGFLGLLLLAIWQFFIFFGTINESDIQGFTYSKQINARFDAAELSIRQAPDQAIQKATAPQTTGESLSSDPNSIQDTQNKRAQLLQQIRSERKALESNAERQLAESRWKAGRDGLRIFLTALIYAWGFRGIAKL